jgi:hypothetical protein
METETIIQNEISIQSLDAFIVATYGIHNCTKDTTKAFELVAIVGETTILKDCCDYWFRLRMLRTCLNGKVESHVWQARFFGRKWIEDEELSIAICKAVYNLGAPPRLKEYYEL